MTISILTLAAAAAAQASAPHSAANAERARAAGYAQAQAALSGSSVQAPLVTSTTGALAVAAPSAGNAVLRVGTEVPLRLEQELTTQGKQVRVGDRFHLTTSEPVLVNGVNVIPLGTPAVGEITEVRNKGMWGKSGRLTARILYMTVGGRQIRLSGNFNDKGVAGGAAAVAVSALVFLPAGFFMTGTSARIPAGSTIKAFLDEDVPLSMPATVTQTPLQVGGAASAMPVQAR